MNASFLPLNRSESPRIRLLCLPYAGASASVYFRWGRTLPKWVELLGAELPGRGTRLDEPCLKSVDSLVATLVGDALLLPRCPTAVFGHSMGAWLGFELTKRLEDRGVPVRHLFVSGRQAPSLGSTLPPMASLDRADFIHEIHTRYNGIPQEVLDTPEYLDMLVPALQADVGALEGYIYPVGDPVSCPITALGGLDDPVVPISDLRPWAKETTAGFEEVHLPGQHFYFEPDPSALLEAIVKRLKLLA